jgi:hypothetical protein
MVFRLFSLFLFRVFLPFITYFFPLFFIFDANRTMLFCAHYRSIERIPYTAYVCISYTPEG